MRLVFYSLYRRWRSLRREVWLPPWSMDPVETRKQKYLTALSSYRQLKVKGGRLLKGRHIILWNKIWALLCLWSLLFSIITFWLCSNLTFKVLLIKMISITSVIICQKIRDVIGQFNSIKKHAVPLKDKKKNKQALPDKYDCIIVCQQWRSGRNLVPWWGRRKLS